MVSKRTTTLKLEALVFATVCFARMVSESTTTPVTAENYALAETQVIMEGYVQKIAKATGTHGVGVFSHVRDSHDPADRTIMRPNFDTLYSMIVLDLTAEATLVMPETGGRYQTAWLVDEEHYNPFALDKPGTYKISQDNVGTRYVFIVVRTQVNMRDASDLSLAGALQDKIEVRQASQGSFVVSNDWDMEEILAMRAKYMKVVQEKKLTSDVLFGKRGDPWLSLENHNCGTAFGWGGFTKDQAVYLSLYPASEEPSTLTLRDVPVAKNAFWSVTVYGEDGFVKGEHYNLNSAFVVTESDGSVTLRFGGDASAPNRLEVYKGCGAILRLYLPTEAYFSGTWEMPKLVPVAGRSKL